MIPSRPIRKKGEARHRRLTREASSLRTQPGLKLYYLDEPGMIRNQNWDYFSPEAQGRNGTDGASDPGPVAPTSRLSSYWPYLLAQDSDRVLRWWRYSDGWEDSNLTIRAPAGSPFVAVPALAPYVDAGAFIYRRSGGDLNNYFADRNGNNDGTSWAKGMPSSGPLRLGRLMLSLTDRPLRRQPRALLHPRRFGPGRLCDGAHGYSGRR